MGTVVGLTTLEQLRTWTKAASGLENDSLLTFIGVAASQAVMDYIGYTVAASGAYTDEEYSGSGMPVLMLRRAPIGAVSSVKINDDQVDADTYTVDEVLGALYRVGTVSGSGFDADLPTPVWPEGYLNIKVSYTTPQYAGLSADQRKVLELCVLFWAGSWFLQKGRDVTMLRERIGEYTYTRAQISEFTTGGMPADLAARLRPYKRTTIA